MPTATHDARDIARWFIAWSDGFDEAGLSNLKLQKLLYYSQGHALAKWGRPLFTQQIEAWAHGPVVADVYHQYKDFGKNPLEIDGEIDWAVTDDATDALLASVWRTYGEFSAWRLREMTHAETPWKATFDPEVRNELISHDLLKKHFSGLYPASSQG